MCRKYAYVHPCFKVIASNEELWICQLILWQITFDKHYYPMNVTFARN